MKNALGVLRMGAEVGYELAVVTLADISVRQELDYLTVVTSVVFSDAENPTKPSFVERMVEQAQQPCLVLREPVMGKTSVLSG